MIVSWIYFRLWYFPAHVINRLYEECYEDKPCPNIQYPALNMLFAFLSGLFFLHIFWFYLMVKGFIRRLMSKGGLKNGVSLKSTVNQ